jgi:hypothetical protein
MNPIPVVTPDAPDGFAYYAEIITPPPRVSITFRSVNRVSLNVNDGQ